MIWFVDPKNTEGFYRHFVFWVYNTWSTAAFFETDIIDVGYDCSTHPSSTGKQLKDEVSTYKEFINSNTGNTVCTFNSGSGMACECFSEKLQEFYGTVCYEKIGQFIEKFGIKMPEKYKECADDVRDMIFQEVVDHKEDESLYEVCEEISSRFGCSGYDIEPFDCSILGVVNGGYLYSNSIFSDYTLLDFKRMLVVE